jgi:hypothetical protein
MVLLPRVVVGAPYRHRQYFGKLCLGEHQVANGSSKTDDPWPILLVRDIREGSSP